MIGVIFSLGKDYIEVRVDNKSIYFRDPRDINFATIDGLKLNKVGVIKEFPDLKGNPRWKGEVIKRFKEKINSLPNENERIKYIIKDLEKYGYVAEFMQKKGYRTVKLKNGKSSI